MWKKRKEPAEVTVVPNEVYPGRVDQLLHFCIDNLKKRVAFWFFNEIKIHI